MRNLRGGFSRSPSQLELQCEYYCHIITHLIDMPWPKTSSVLPCHICISCRRLWQHVTEALLQKDMEKATEHKRFLEERQRKEERHRTETEMPWRTKYFERKVNTFINTQPNLFVTPTSKPKSSLVLGVVWSLIIWIIKTKRTFLLKMMEVTWSVFML